MSTNPGQENLDLSSLQQLVAQGFGRFANDPSLKLVDPAVIRAGLLGGLPFDNLTTDFYTGCLPAKATCYGNCFAAKASYAAGIDFGSRVKNILEPEGLTRDLDAISKDCAYVRNGWNSDPSWAWDDAAKLAKLIRDSGRRPVFLTKGFKLPSPAALDELARCKSELRVCISAFDTDSQLAMRMKLINSGRDAGALAVPVLMSARFKIPGLNERQDRIVDKLLALDLPASENSIRFLPDSPVIAAIDLSACGKVSDTGDLWAGLLYRDKLRVPTLSSTSVSYPGVDPYLSKNDPAFLDSLFADPVPTNEEVRSGVSRSKPACAGVPINWQRTTVTISAPPRRLDGADRASR